MKLRRNEYCPIHRSLFCCGREPVRKQRRLIRMGAVESLRNFLNQNNLTIVGVSITINGTTSTLGESEIPADAVLVKTINENGVIIDVWQLSDTNYNPYDNPETQFQQFLADAAAVQNQNIIFSNPFTNMINFVNWWNSEFGCGGIVVECGPPPVP